MSLREQVEAALDRVPVRDGATVVGEGMKVLAERDPMRDGGHVLIYLGVPACIRGSQADSGSERWIPQGNGGYVLERPVENS